MRTNNDSFHFLYLENKLRPMEFFEKLKEEERDDPKNVEAREIWFRNEEYVFEFRLIFTAHFNRRRFERWFPEDIKEDIIRQLSNNEVLKAITNHTLYWEDGKIVGNDGDDIRAVAVIEEDVPFVCIYECGQSFVCPKTILQKQPKMFFRKDTEVLVVNREGNVSQK